MKHLQFEEWLLTEEKLSASQEAELVKHTETCQSCNEFAAAAREMQNTFRKIEFAVPEPGFTARWEQNLERYEYRRRSWKGWLLLSLAVIFVASIFLATALPAIASPSSIVPQILEGLGNVAAIVSAIVSIFESAARLLPQISPALLISIVNFSIIALVSVWLIAIKQITYKQGVRK